MHFNTGGKILRVGRTGQNLDALLVEDEEYSHGHAHLLKESFIEAKINVSSPRGNYKVDINAWDFLENTTGYPEDLTAHYSTIVRNATYLPTIQITEGPLYFVICIFGHGTENYMKCAFGKCAVPRVDLPYSRFRLVRGNCSVAFLERSTAKSGIFRGFEPEASSLRYLDLAFGHVDVSFLGQGSIMINDLAITLQSKPCGDTYVAYLPPSNISRTSVVIVCALGITALASCVAAIMSLFITRHTFNWNGSYQRVVSLAASSEQMRVFGRNDFAAVATADVVIEERPTHHGKGLCVRIVPTDATSNPVPKASRKLLQ
ncbi:hypothetical protein BWQ96_07440 [Gracilariopsis chorda]|uniref:Uncharacterized protein n=1 Tax=Gracilariopsis chorda TaxID=448386 RepID=A0A2V3IL84_9FLOR|nr:hypothetical protein BWQ96_07440 [Gracilariopsis chorda]|eukprot:PXF42846.1 hypothetical protein BWQ96_07440 [Gracilariopsis chorda]